MRRASSPPTARPERLYAFAKRRAERGLQGHHCRRRRGRPSAGHDGLDDDPSGARRSGRKPGAQRPGQSLFDRADAARHSGRHARHRQAGRDQCRPPRRQHPGAPRSRRWPSGCEAWRAKQTAAVAEAPQGRAPDAARTALCRPAPPSAYWAAANLAACWRSPPLDLASNAISLRPRPTVRPSRWPPRIPVARL